MKQRRGYRNQATEERKPQWTAVVNPRPVFEGGPAHKARYEQALADTPRLEGEDVCAWLERVGRAAAPVGDRELAREPGEDG